MHTKKVHTLQMTAHASPTANSDAVASAANHGAIHHARSVIIRSAVTATNTIDRATHAALRRMRARRRSTLDSASAARRAVMSEFLSTRKSRKKIEP